MQNLLWNFREDYAPFNSFSDIKNAKHNQANQCQQKQNDEHNGQDLMGKHLYFYIYLPKLKKKYKTIFLLIVVFMYF